MTPCQVTTDSPECQEPFRWPRTEATALLEQALHGDEPLSLRAFAEAHEIPYATLRYWRQRRAGLDTSEPLRAFFESPAGLDFLHRLVLAAHLTFQQTGACGLRLLRTFFRYLPVQPFLACSYGTHQRLASHIQDLIVRFGQEQRQELAPAMPRRKITLCEDENFHQGSPCLVAIEPVSNFLLVEVCCERRDGGTWTQVVTTALEGLPVSVAQVSSDEAKGIVAHARDGLGAHHSPDLMHQQQDLHQATALPLQAQVEKAQEEVLQAELQAWRITDARHRYEEGPPRPGRPPDFAGAFAAVKQQYQQACQRVESSQQHQEQAREAIRGLGDDYHPFDADGTAQSVAGLQQKLQGRLAVVEAAAAQAAVSEAGKKKIRKVKKVVPQLVATLAWFWLQVNEVIQVGGYSEAQQELLRGPLLAWVYWQQACSRGRDAAHRRHLAEAARRCGAAVEGNATWQGCTEEERQRLLQAARECAGRWVRSSSCVEGRNGYLRLRHHGRRGFSAKGLQALTVLHNYWIRRADGTTAAQRFFGQEHDDLFDWLRQRLPQLPRPAQPRPRKAA